MQVSLARGVAHGFGVVMGGGYWGEWSEGCAVGVCIFEVAGRMLGNRVEVVGGGVAGESRWWRMWC